MMPDVFNYYNYRKFIKDYYDHKKTTEPRFSYQLFAAKAGFRSKTSLANVTSGIQALSKDKIHYVARAMNLNKKEAEYFRTLVFFNEAKSTEERKELFEKMRSLAPKSDVPQLIDAQYEYYSQWYHCVIRELVTFVDFKGDYKKLADMVYPPITAQKARKSLELLMQLGMIKKTGNGLYAQTDRMLTSGNEVATMALQNFHMKHLALASDSIDRCTRSLREITSVTVGISAGGYKKILDETSLFRQRIMEIVGQEDETDAVYQVALQVYPISKTPKGWRPEDE